MMVLGTIGAASLAVLLSELIGRGKVVYTRMLTLVVSYVVACAAVTALLVFRGGSLLDGLAIALSAVPFMAAWLGFRIHLSNSVTLEMVTLLEERGPQSTQGMIAAYDPQGHTATRMRILREAQYLVGPDDRTADTPKGRAVLRLMAVVCGPQGPRAVTEMLRRRGTGR